MKSKFTNHFIYFLFVMLCSCSDKDSKQKEIHLFKDYNRIQDIVSIADCDSPFGKYTTEVHSFIDGSCYFRQNFAVGNSPFIVKLDSINRGYIINEKQMITDTLAEADVEMIRGHEIHKMSINPKFFFNNIVFKKQVKYLDIDHELFAARDRLDNPVEITYNRDKKLISKIELLNSKDTSQTIEIIFDKWLQSKYGELVQEIRIIQAIKDTFYFDYKSLKIRDETGYNNVYNSSRILGTNHKRIR